MFIYIFNLIKLAFFMYATNLDMYKMQYGKVRVFEFEILVDTL